MARTETIISNIDQLKSNLREALYLDLDDFGLEIQRGEVISQFIGLLVAGNTNAQVDLKKGALCKLEIETLRCGRCATLAWLLTPKQMLLMV